MFKVKGQRSWSLGYKSRSQRKVMYQQQKRYNTAMDKFSDFQLGMASGDLKLQCIRNCHVF